MACCGRSAAHRLRSQSVLRVCVRPVCAVAVVRVCLFDALCECMAGACRGQGKGTSDLLDPNCACLRAREFECLFGVLKL